MNDFQVFIERNAKTLKHLTIYCEEDFEESRKTLLCIITKAINLVHLGINNIDMITDQLLANYWKEIAIKCKQIKSLRLDINENKNMRINGETLSILKQFKRLKRLDFVTESRGIALNLIQDFGEGFKRLTHLHIFCL